MSVQRKDIPVAQGIFDVGVKKISGLARAAGGGHHGVDVACIHHGGDVAFAPFTALRTKSLLLRELLSLAPQLWPERDMGIGLLDLLVW